MSPAPKRPAAPKTRPADDRDGRERDAQIVAFPGPRRLPDLPAGAEVEPAAPVVEGEIVTDTEFAERTGRLQRYVPPPLVVVVQRVVVVVRPRTATAGRATLRTGVTVGQGLGSWVRRGYDGATLGVYRRAIASAEAAGDRDGLADWVQRREQVKEARHRRLMDAPKLAAGLGILAGIGLGCLVAGVLLVGLVVQVAGAGTFLGVISGVLGAVRWTVAAVPVVVTVAAVVTLPVVLVAAWREGHRRGSPPRWLAVPGAGGGDVMDGLPDEGTIINALRNLNIPGFTRALKEGWRIRFVLQPTVDGKGWRAQLDLPPSCPVEEIVKRKTMLAHNLVRFPIEVWPTEPRPTVLDLWVADPGALSGPVDPWPLLEDLDQASTDYFAGVPAGVTIKGDVVRGQLFEKNYVVGGMMGSGKSTLVITLLLGAMLDPLVDIDVVVMAENADYEPMAPRLRSLVTGAGEDTVQTCLGRLQELYGEVSLRGQALREHDARAVTRTLAQQDDRLRPRIVVVDECQNLFIGEHGKAAIEVASKLMSTARKYAITLMFLTPEPSKDALPRKLISIASNKACFAIGDQLGNDAVLGTGSYKSGISAVGLTPKTDEDPGDVGTCMAKGFTRTPGLLRSFYVAQGDAHRVTQRALQLRAGRGGGAPAPAVEGATVDHLATIAEVLRGEQRVRTQVVLSRLAERDPATYERWTFSDLKAALKRHPAINEDAKSNGHQVVRLDEITEALTERDRDDDDTP